MSAKRFKFIGVSRLQPPDVAIDLFNILNMLVLLGMFFLLNSRFIISPGIGIELAKLDIVEARKTVGVLTVQSERLIMFNGDIFTLDSLGYGMKKYLKKVKPSEKDGNDPVLLVRPDKSLSVNVLLKICSIAKDAGYENVQIAISPVAQK
ncbi:MAG: biopolymer transporter ExbD [Puniceicoccales bacterium]|jgi:biopolymer transport protein ExbD|nr:biopolymer transporter ExbD [Puniceicoccales bacterium]